MRIQVKALSVNGSYRGRRFSTPELKAFKEEVFLRLPRISVPSGPLMMRYEFGVSSSASDLDNCVKSFQDCLAEKYGFNDNKIYRCEMEKKVVPKGQEYIDFEIITYENATLST